MLRKIDMSPELLLYNFEIAFAKVMNYPHNKKHQADLILYEKEMLRRLGGNYEIFTHIEDLPKKEPE